MPTPPDKLAAAKNALAKANNFTKTVEGKSPSQFAFKPKANPMPQPKPPVSAPTGLGAELGSKASNVREYANAYPKMHSGGVVPADGVYCLKAGEEVIPAGGAKAKVKIKLEGNAAQRFLENSGGQREDIPSGLRHRAKPLNHESYYREDGQVKPENHQPHDRYPVKNTGSNPATSQAQQRLMAAAEHGANFPAAKKIRKSMTHEQMHDFAATPRKGLPKKAKKK
jgi:hypothetical protein